MQETMNMEWVTIPETHELEDLLNSAEYIRVLLNMYVRDVKRGESTVEEMREYISGLFGEVLTGQKTPEEEAKEYILADIKAIKHELERRKNNVNRKES